MKTWIILFVNLLILTAVNAQEFLLTSSKEIISVTVLSIDADKIQFTLFGNSDTTHYFLKRDEVVAIGFTKQNLKKLQDPEFKELPAFKSVNPHNHNEFIYPEKGDIVKATIDTFLENQVQFRIAFSSDTSKYYLLKSEIAQITLNELKSAESTNENDLETKGIADANSHYMGYTGAATGSFIAGLVFWFYLLPLIVPIATAATPPADYNLGYPKRELMEKPAYAKAYTRTAANIKSTKAWSNFGIGVGCSLGFFALIFVAAFSSLRY